MVWPKIKKKIGEEVQVEQRQGGRTELDELVSSGCWGGGDAVKAQCGQVPEGLVSHHGE